MVLFCGTRTLFFINIFLLLSLTARSQTIVETSDITRFWQMYDRLVYCSSEEDSVQWIQTQYLDKASKGFKEFQKVRDLDARYYLKNFRNSPSFWASLRPRTEDLENRTEEVHSVLDQFENRFKHFKRPKVCFAIGALSTGGTISSGWLLIGAEIVMADSSVNKEELNSWLQFAMQDHDQLKSFIAHETVHTMQRNTFSVLWGYLFTRKLTMSMLEGAADFIALEVAGETINANLYAYGYRHEESIKRRFSEDLYNNDSDSWLYNGLNAENGPADLGYFIGSQACNAYFNKQNQSSKALKKIALMKRPKSIAKKSDYFNLVPSSTE